MNWLKEHVYIAVWLGLPLSIILTIIQSRKPQFARVDWFRSVLYFAFLMCLAVLFTPAFDMMARFLAGTIAGVLLGYIVAFRNEG